MIIFNPCPDVLLILYKESNSELMIEVAKLICKGFNLLLIM
jgi:hypothetical protein